MKKIEDLQKHLEEENPPLQAILTVLITEINDIKAYLKMPVKTSDDIVQAAQDSTLQEPVKESLWSKIKNSLNPFA